MSQDAWSWNLQQSSSSGMKEVAHLFDLNSWSHKIQRAGIIKSVLLIQRGVLIYGHVKRAAPRSMDQSTPSLWPSFT